MTVVTAFPRQVREIEHVWIPLSDGARLAARIWLPEDAERDPVPAILEYIPYRKNDGTAPLDAPRHPYFAGHGYAAVRVDLRGSGDSDGLLLDEYLPQEHADALEVLAWLAAQPWCTGRVGMMGYSWGGFNALQVAALRPPQLQAIVTCCASDDRYATDAHYMGGCLLSYDMLSWATTFLAMNGRAPDPHYVGDSWRETWLKRLEASRPFIAEWLDHQTRDAYWRHGSVTEDLAAIQCPVYAIGGWADPYHDAALRLAAGLRSPSRALIGPWAHGYPDTTPPGPNIGFLDECLRWWDHWLKDQPNAITDEPPVRLWLQDPVTPARFHAERPGRWITEPSWPSPSVTETPLFLVDRALSPEPGPPAAVPIRTPQQTGMDAGTWAPYGGPHALAGDQIADDGRSVCFTTAPLASDLNVVGLPRAELVISSNRPLALLAARLCDVTLTGESTLISRGLLNLTHRDGHEAPQPLVPDREYRANIELSSLAQIVPAGHRLRLALSSTYWPWAWPSPDSATVTLILGESCLALPVRAEREEPSPAPFGEPRLAPGIDVEMVRPALGRRVHSLDAGSERVELFVEPDYLIGARRLSPSGLLIEDSGTDTYALTEGDPLSAEVRCVRTMTVGRGDWDTRVEAFSRMTCDEQNFYVKARLEAFEHSARIFARTWEVTIPRNAM